MCLLHIQTLHPGRQRQQEWIKSEQYLMNGLLVTLLLLLLLFSSLHTSHAPILVLKKIACAIRVSLHSWVLNYSGERGTTKDAARKAVLYSRTGPLWRMGGILTPAGCITGLSVWFSVSDQLSPAVGESQNSQNAMLPTQSECASWELGGIQLFVTSEQRRCFSLINSVSNTDVSWWRQIKMLGLYGTTLN